MRLIVPEAIRITAFRSFVEETVIEFPIDSGLHYLTGANLIEPRLGSNGAGKSTIWDAVVWCCYNVSPRGQRAADLANWRVGGRPHVVFDLSIDGTRHAIDRTGSPDKLLLDGTPATQAQVDALLGLSLLQFLHSVVFGQTTSLFMDLPVSERGELLGEVCQLDFWEDMAEFASRRAVEMSREVQELERDLAHDNGALSGLVDQLDALHEAEQQWDRQQRDELAKARDDYQVADFALRCAEQALRKCKTALDDLPDEQESTRLLAQLQSEAHTLYMECVEADTEHRHLMDHIFFLRDNTTCPTCRRPIDRRFQFDETKRLESERDAAQDRIEQCKIRHHEKKQRISQEQGINRELAGKREQLRAQLADLRVSEASRQQMLVAARQRLDQVNQGVNPHREQKDRLLATAERLEADIQTADAEIAKLRPELERVEYWKQGFRQVRLFLIRRVLALLEIETASAAAQLGVGNWRISFSTEMETKRGSMRPGIFVTAYNAQGNGDYRSYSPGEAQRIKLAVSLGLASFIQSMAAVYYALEVWDEPTEHLSMEGVEDLAECLQQRAASTGRCIWLVDPRIHSFPFDAVWRVTKDTTGSRAERIA